MNVLARLKPGRSVSVQDAEKAAGNALTAYRSASARVDQVVARFPTPDRRVIAANMPSAFRFDLADYTLSSEEREVRQRRHDFQAAVAAETLARSDLEAAERLRDDVRRAAELVALGDGRAALVTALRRQRAAEETAANHEKAIDAARDTLWETSRSIEAAEADLEKATADAAGHAIAVVTGTAGAAPRTPREVRADIQDLKDAHEATGGVLKALQDRRDTVQSEALWAADAVKEAIVHVVSVAPETSALMAAYAKAHADWLYLQGALDVLRRAGLAPKEYDNYRAPAPSATNPLAGAWADAVAALRVDPATKLPGAAP